MDNQAFSNGREGARRHPALDPSGGADPSASSDGGLEDDGGGAAELPAGVRTRAARRSRAATADPPPPDLEKLARTGDLGRVAAPYDPETQDRLPHLWQLLTMDVYSDGCKRILPTLRVVREPGQLVVCLQDHETCRQVTAASTTLSGLWEALEAAVRSALNWRGFKSHLNRTGEAFSLRKKKSGQP